MFQHMPLHSSRCSNNNSLSHSPTLCDPDIINTWPSTTPAFHLDHVSPHQLQLLLTDPPSILHAPIATPA